MCLSHGESQLLYVLAESQSTGPLAGGLSHREAFRGIVPQGA